MNDASFDCVLVADWSAAQGRKAEPTEDRCWIAWGTPDDRSEPVYQATRLEAEAAIRAVIADHPDSRILLGIDAAIGLPVAEDGTPVLPTGREWIALLASMITDSPAGNNNRFEVAAELNKRIRTFAATTCGPFWGRPKEHKLIELPEKRPSGTGVVKLRACEVAARKATKTKPKSPWQLAGAGSVGSQALMAAPLIHRLLTHEDTADRAVLWPFDDLTHMPPNAVVIAEVYPSMYPERAPKYWYRDARQVCDTRDAILDGPAGSPIIDHPLARVEGWIWDVPVASHEQSDHGTDSE